MAISPTDISGCVLWLKADQITASDGDLIATWSDQSGTGHDGTQATSGKRPIYKVNILNGKPALRFGTSAETWFIFSDFISGYTAGTGFVVFKNTSAPPSGSAIGSPWGRWDTDPNSHHIPYVDSNVYFGWGSTVRYSCGNPGALNVFKIMTVSSAPNDWSVWFNQVLLYNTTTNTVGFDTVPVIGSDGSVYTDGYIAEVIMYSSALSTIERQRVEFYLSQKYAVGGLVSPDPLPSTNLTFHVKANTNTKLFKTYPTSGGHPVDGDNCETWQSDVDTKLLTWNAGEVRRGPTYKTVTPLLPFPCTDFKNPSDDGGITEFIVGDAFVASDVMGASAKTIIVAFNVVGSSSNNGTVYGNNGLVVDQAQYWGLHLRNNSGSHEIIGYNWHGGIQTVALTYSLSTNYIATFRHDGTNIYLSLNGGAESSTASQSTDNMGGGLYFGFTQAAAANMRIGEVAIYNAALTGTTLSNANDYLYNKWVLGVTDSDLRFSQFIEGIVTKTPSVDIVVSQEIEGIVSRPIADVVISQEIEGIVSRPIADVVVSQLVRALVTRGRSARINIFVT